MFFVVPVFFFFPLSSWQAAPGGPVLPARSYEQSAGLAPGARQGPQRGWQQPPLPPFSGRVLLCKSKDASAWCPWSKLGHVVQLKEMIIEVSYQTIATASGLNSSHIFCFPEGFGMSSNMCTLDRASQAVKPRQNFCVWSQMVNVDSSSSCAEAPSSIPILKPTMNLRHLWSFGPTGNKLQ